MGRFQAKMSLLRSFIEVNVPHLITTMQLSVGLEDDWTHQGFLILSQMTSVHVHRLLRAAGEKECVKEERMVKRRLFCRKKGWKSCFRGSCFPKQGGGGNRISSWVKSCGLRWDRIDWRRSAEELLSDFTDTQENNPKRVANNAKSYSGEKFRKPLGTRRRLQLLGVIPTTWEVFISLTHCRSKNNSWLF